MVTWELLTQERARLVWDETLSRFDDGSPFQSYAWGEYRRGLGWEPYRWAAFDDRREIVAMMQGCVRRHHFGFGLLWSEGGPVGDLAVCDGALQSAIVSTVGLKRIYCRFRCDRARSVADVLQLTAQGWRTPWACLNSNFSMLLDLTEDEEVVLARRGRNWKQNLRRAGKSHIRTELWREPSVDEILGVYRSMQDLKGLEEQQSQEEIEQLLRNLSDHLVIYRSDDEEGNLLSLAGALVVGRHANFWLAANTNRGRELHAAYACFSELIQHCRKIGVRFYDMGGIDPVGNPGVYRFKKGSGATHLELLGEWDWASRPWLRWFGNWAIAQRRRVRRTETALARSRGTSKKQNGIGNAPVVATAHFRES
jgi:hypothetical protein